MGESNTPWKHQQPRWERGESGLYIHVRLGFVVRTQGGRNREWWWYRRDGGKFGPHKSAEGAKRFAKKWTDEYNRSHPGVSRVG